MDTEERIYPYKGNSACLFVSYDPRDWTRISGLLRQMRDRGLRFWMSNMTPPGPELDDIIAGKLEGCDTFVAFLSDRYLNNPDVMDELNYSRDLNKKQLLIYLESSELSAGVQMRMSRALSLRWDNYASEQALFADMMKTEGIERFYGVESPELDAKIKQKLQRLDLLYPDHRVFALRGLDSELAEALARLAGESEYDTVAELLQAYGYVRVEGDEARRLRGGPICTPGAEPEVIRKAVVNAFQTLGSYYPDKKIADNLQRSHKALHARLQALHLWLGYEDLTDFLRAYGFQYYYVPTVGRQSYGDEAIQRIFNELREKYRDRENPESYADLLSDNPELAPALKTLSNRSRELFGVTLREKLVQEEIIRSTAERVSSAFGSTALEQLRGFYPDDAHGSYEEALDRLDGVRLRTTRDQKILISRAYDCDEELLIPYGISGVSKEAFSESPGVRRVVLPETCTALSERAFAGCDTLEEIVLPEGLQSLETEVFAGCESLRTVVIPATVKRIRARAFCYCTELEKIVIPASVEVIESGAFQGCSALSQVELQSPKTSIFDGAFEGCPFRLPEQDLKGVEFTYSTDKKNNAIITGFTGETAQLELPEILHGHPVTGIAKGVFTEHTELREIVLPDSVVDAKGDVFRGCTNLERLHLSNGLSKLTSSAFAECRSLREVNIPEALTEVKRGLFKDSPVELLRVGKSTRRIDANAFYHREYDPVSGNLVRGKPMRRVLIDPENPYLRAEGTLLFSADGKLLQADLGNAEEYAVPEGVEEIGEDVFSGNTFLRSIRFPSTLRSIGAKAFAGTSLETLRFPESLRSIGERAFSFCRKLREAKLPEGLEAIGDQAFEGCPIGEVRLPASLQSLGNSCFAALSSYPGETPQRFEVALANDLYHADGTMLYWTSGEDHVALKAYGSELRSPYGKPQPADQRYRLEAGTTAIADQAFYRCDRLCAVELPETVRSIGRQAFMECTSLTEANVPPEAEIEPTAFSLTPLQA